jgi:hypothetical protein
MSVVVMGVNGFVRKMMMMMVKAYCVILGLLMVKVYGFICDDMIVMVVNGFAKVYGYIDWD